MATFATLFSVEYDWRVTLLCECAPLLVQLLKHKFPDAEVCDNMNKKPWLAWAAAGLTALVVYAGIACQPFSKASMMRQHLDKRAWQARPVLEAAVAVGALYIILENVAGYVDNDSEHGVFSIMVGEYAKAGFDLVEVLRPRHDLCGGQTARLRVLLVFKRRQHERRPRNGDGWCVDVHANPVAHGMLDGWQPDLGDARRNWSLYGSMGPVTNMAGRNPLAIPARRLTMNNMDVSSGGAHQGR